MLVAGAGHALMRKMAGMVAKSRKPRPLRAPILSQIHPMIRRKMIVPEMDMVIDRPHSDLERLRSSMMYALSDAAAKVE
jgi:hypothetical protein